jgi:hypothetical protein
MGLLMCVCTRATVLHHTLDEAAERKRTTTLKKGTALEKQSIQNYTHIISLLCRCDGIEQESLPHEGCRPQQQQ